MERVFANLYRVNGSNRRGTSHTYFLKRKQGNALVCHQAPVTPEDLDEIEAMGGLESQWVCHSHDLMQGDAHEQVYERFGAPLHHHKIDRPRVRKKTQCERVEFEGDGAEHGSDFEAIYLPTCTPGHSIYRWSHRGKYYLFTSHAIYHRDGDWLLQFNPGHGEGWEPQLVPLAKRQVDYLFPGYTEEQEDSFYRLSDRMQKSFARALRKKAAALPKPPSIAVPGPTRGVAKGFERLTFVEREGGTAQIATTAGLGWDGKHLHVDVDCAEPEVGRLKRLATERDSRSPAIWDDDVVEIFVSADAKDRSSCYQFIINPNGAVLDAYYADSSRMKPDFTWDADIDVKATVGNKRWTVKAKIPWADLGIEAQAGTQLAVNLYRVRVCDGPPQYSGWSPVGRRLHLAPSRFGVVTLAAKG